MKHLGNGQNCLNFLQREGGVEQFEMYRTFNCGVGMVLAVDAADADKTVERLNSLGEKALLWGIYRRQC
jgi:phosphoribosylformylglycinamidine cyclo-ligase